MTIRLPQTAYAVLGLVSVRPRAGHELARYAERSIGNFFPLTRSHVYSELDRLCRLGLLDATEVPQERLPTKRVYEITGQGERVLQDWLEESALGPERQRNPFLVRMFFA
ncbi:MAG: PadR family transcriptional regulator, partial [Chloroflexi bacterium]|nr:PadR family transcriptional regulator [Chloroflexota bacterium]